MPEDRDQVRVSLQKYFSAKLQESIHFETYVNIGSYLSDPSQYRRGLKRLEAALAELFDIRLKSVRDYLCIQEKIDFSEPALLKLLKGIRDGRHTSGNASQEIAPFVPYSKLLFGKLLSSVLYEWEKEAGFVHDSSGKADILLGAPTSLFNLELKAGRPFKDMGAGKVHGEHTHRIQWCLVGMGLPLDNAGAVYRNVASWITTAQQPGIDNSGPYKRYLWEFLFDRDGTPSNASSVHFNCVDKFDFRAPSNLNRAALEDGLNCPFLSWCLKDRYQKRANHYDAMEYFARKAPSDLNAQAIGAIPGRIMSKEFDGTDLALMKRLNQGLFIRRGQQIVDVQWQA